MTSDDYKLNETVTVLLADTDLVKGMLQNLGCTTYGYACTVFDALRARSAPDRATDACNVHPDAIRYVLRMIPPLADSEPDPEPMDKQYGYKYRIGRITLYAVWDILDRSAKHRIAGGDGWLPPGVARLIWSGYALYGDRWQSDIAKALGINDRRVRAWLQAERSIPDGIWADIAALLRQRQHESIALLRELDAGD